MKTKMLGWALGVLLLVPGAGAYANEGKAETYGKNLKESGNFQHENDHYTMDKKWHERMKQKEQKLLEMANTYTPEKKKEWERVINERNQMREKWLSPEFAKKRALWKKEKMSKLNEYQKLYDEGKISKEEFIKKVHGTKAMGNWKTYDELKAAVKEKNNKKASLLLNQLLVQYKQQNKWIKAAMYKL